jgi:regulator of protease activity HflC (stomatin/prohibitin superfamily)
MFDKLITLIQQFIKELLPTFIIDEWEEGIVLRNGKYIKTVKAGIYLKIPFFDSIWRYNVITQSIDIPPQSVTTADGYNVVVKGIIRFTVSDIKTFLLTITQPQDVLTDTTGGMIREIIEDTAWANIIDIDKKLTSEVGKFVKKWGIKVEKVTLTDLQIANSIRIIQDSTHQSKVLPINEHTYE